MLQRVPRSGILVGKFLEPQTIRGNRPSRFRAHRRFRPAHGMRMLLTRAGAKTHEEEGHPPVDLFSSAMALGRRLEAALAVLAACPPTVTSDRKIRDSLVEQAGYALWLFVVQREACGLNDSAQVMQDYGVPNEVYARMGPLTMPSIHPTKTVGVKEAAAPMFRNSPFAAGRCVPCTSGPPQNRGTLRVRR